MATRDAVIVGAGPAGSLTALLLARAGYDVLLLDRTRFPRDKPCSEYLTPGTTHVLQRVGESLLERLEGAAHARLYGLKVVSPAGREAVGRFDCAPVSPSRPYSFALARTTFDVILRDAAVRAGAALAEAFTVEDLVMEHGSVTGVVGRPATGGRAMLHARVVVGADGLRSVVARRLGAIRRWGPRRVAFAAHFAGVAGVGDVGEMHVGRSGYVGLGPIGDGVTTVALVVPRRGARRAASGLPGAFVDGLEQFPGLRGRFREARMIRPVLATGPFAQMARRVTVDGACLVGDAADFFDPFTGQGIYAALRGAELMAQALMVALRGRGIVSARAMRPYAAGRRRVFAGKWLLERLIGIGIGWPALAERVVMRMARRPDLADALVGATGNFVPAHVALAPARLAGLVW